MSLGESKLLAAACPESLLAKPLLNFPRGGPVVQQAPLRRSPGQPDRGLAQVGFAQFVPLPGEDESI